jgi:hypothetical protein
MAATTCALGFFYSLHGYGRAGGLQPGFLVLFGIGVVVVAIILIAAIGRNGITWRNRF